MLTPGSIVLSKKKTNRVPYPALAVEIWEEVAGLPPLHGPVDEITSNDFFLAM